MQTTLLPTAGPASAPPDHATTLRRLADLALERHQQHVTQRVAIGRPPGQVFLRAALRCATWLTRHAQRQDDPEAAVLILAPLVPLLTAIANAAEAGDRQDEASGAYTGQPLTVWITCVTRQSQVDELLAWARNAAEEPATVAPVRHIRSAAPDLADLDARLAVLLKQTAHLLGDDPNEEWDDLLDGGDAALALTG